MQGIISKSTGSWYKVLVDGQEKDARLRGILRTKELKSTNPVVVGDLVELETEDGEYFIKDITDRRNCIVRKSNKLSKQYQVIAANIDMALLVISPANPYTPQGFIDRFLITAEAYQIPVTLLLNKSDLDSKKANQHREYLMNLYTSIGYNILNVSFLEKESVMSISKLASGKTVLLCGNSGVGKSTLVNSLDESINQKVGTISKSYHKGKHTTTFAQMFVLEDGTRIIDTPGIKDFGIVNLERNQLSHYLPEMKKALHLCKFNNCLHLEEPDCQIQLLLNNGEINEQRYLNYSIILSDI